MVARLQPPPPPRNSPSNTHVHIIPIIHLFPFTCPRLKKIIYINMLSITLLFISTTQDYTKIEPTFAIAHNVHTNPPGLVKCSGRGGGLVILVGWHTYIIKTIKSTYEGSPAVHTLYYTVTGRTSYLTISAKTETKIWNILDDGSEANMGLMCENYLKKTEVEISWHSHWN